MKWKIGIAAALGVALVAWVGFYFLGGGFVRHQYFNEAKKAVADRSHDPDSTQFRNLAYYEDIGLVCGEANGKNLFGAYSGYVKFEYGPKIGLWMERPDDAFGRSYARCQAQGKR